MHWLFRMVFLVLLLAAGWRFHSGRQQRESRVQVAAREGILLAGNGTEIETLDMHLATGAPEHKVISALFEGLVAPLPEQPDGNGPGAAKSWEQRENFRVWTFHLQPKGRWSDGQPVTAHDFVYAYQRILSPDLAADYAEMLYSIQGAAAFNKGELKDFRQVGVKALDDLTLEIQLNGPAPYFPGMLKHYTWYPVPRHVVEKQGGMMDRNSPWTKLGNIVGNGPFQLKEWRFTQVLKVERNPHYWDAAVVQLKEIHFFPMSSDSTEERAFQDGQLHLTSTLPLTLIPEFMAMKDPRFHNHPLLACAFYRYNTTKPPFQDKRVRKALSLAIDRRVLVEQVLKAGQIPATALTPPGTTEGYATPDLLRFDPVEARRLLAEAGFPEGRGFPAFEILINTNEAHRILAQAIQSMLQKHLKIPAKILNQDWQVYLESQRKQQYMVCRAGWMGDYPDPFTFLSIWRTGDGNNNTGFSSSAYDALLDRSIREPDPAQRLKILVEAETLLMEEQPILPLYWQNHTYLMRPEVKGHGSSVMEHRCYKALRIEL